MTKTDYVAGWILPEEGRTRDEVAHELVEILAASLPAGPGDRLVTESYFDPAVEAHRLVLHRVPEASTRDDSPEEREARLRLTLEEAIASPGGRAVAEAILERKRLADALEGRKIDLSGSIPVELPGAPVVAKGDLVGWTSGNGHWTEGGARGLMDPVELSPAMFVDEEGFAREIADRGAEILDQLKPQYREAARERVKELVDAGAGIAEAVAFATGRAPEARPINSNATYPTLADREQIRRTHTPELAESVEDRLDREIDEAIGRGEI